MFRNAEENDKIFTDSQDQDVSTSNEDIQIIENLSQLQLGQPDTPRPHSQTSSDNESDSDNSYFENNNLLLKDLFESNSNASEESSQNDEIPNTFIIKDEFFGDDSSSILDSSSSLLTESSSSLDSFFSSSDEETQATLEESIVDQITIKRLDEYITDLQATKHDMYSNILITQANLKLMQLQFSHLEQLIKDSQMEKNFIKYHLKNNGFFKEFQPADVEIAIDHQSKYSPI